jgi:hypothetical protein
LESLKRSLGRNQAMDGIIILEWILGTCGKVWAGCIWLRTSTSKRLF